MRRLPISVLAVLFSLDSACAAAAKGDAYQPEDTLTQEWCAVTSAGWRAPAPKGFKLMSSDPVHVWMWKREWLEEEASTEEKKRQRYEEHISFGARTARFQSASQWEGIPGCSRKGPMIERFPYGHRSYLFECKDADATSWDLAAIVLIRRVVGAKDEYLIAYLDYSYAPAKGFPPSDVEPPGRRSFLRMLSELQPVPKKGQ